MTAETSQPNEVLQFYQKLFAAPEILTRSGSFAEQFAQTARKMLDAQIAYSHAVIKAQEQLLEIWFYRPVEENEDRPSVAARKHEVNMV